MSINPFFRGSPMYPHHFFDDDDDDLPAFPVAILPSPCGYSSPPTYRTGGNSYHVHIHNHYGSGGSESSRPPTPSLPPSRRVLTTKYKTAYDGRLIKVVYYSDGTKDTQVGEFKSY